MPANEERLFQHAANAAHTPMTYHHTSNSKAAKTDDSLGHVLGACAVIGVGLVVASLAPAASPIILGRAAFEAGRIIGRR